uniref:HMG box domain-containing protein n=1 Tax=Odontella aurita TaxID=265563 RepID=A0A7S4NEB4_9STRA|mmetsp:Transcript_59983/g.177859  ORF Transcript_59983/g.177859 Transcript_59983/m.177859 type:complete len:512 (+) Transcript_59983:308-1843(+)
MRAACGNLSPRKSATKSIRFNSNAFDDADECKIIMAEKNKRCDGETTTSNKSQDRKKDNSNNGREKPKRPLSAYNLFFRYERKRILASSGVHLPSSPSSSSRRGGDLYGKSRSGARLHRKSHGLIGFKDLARAVASRWKAANDETRCHFSELAAAEKERYRAEMERYTNKGVEEGARSVAEGGAVMASSSTNKDQQCDSWQSSSSSPSRARHHHEYNDHHAGHHRYYHQKEHPPGASTCERRSSVTIEGGWAHPHPYPLHPIYQYPYPPHVNSHHAHHPPPERFSGKSGSSSLSAAAAAWPSSLDWRSSGGGIPLSLPSVPPQSQVYSPYHHHTPPPPCSVPSAHYYPHHQGAHCNANTPPADHSSAEAVADGHEQHQQWYADREHYSHYYSSTAPCKPPCRADVAQEHDGRFSNGAPAATTSNHGNTTSQKRGNIGADLEPLPIDYWRPEGQQPQLEMGQLGTLLPARTVVDSTGEKKRGVGEPRTDRSGWQGGNEEQQSLYHREGEWTS